MKLYLKMVIFWFALNGGLLLANEGWIYPHGGTQTPTDFENIEENFNSTELALGYTQGEEQIFGDIDYGVGSMWSKLAGMFTGFPNLLSELALPTTLALVIRGLWSVSWALSLWYLITGRG